MLQHHQIIALKHGSVVFYHEGQTDSGHAIYFLIHVPGERIPAYFDFLSRSQNFDLSILENYGHILDRGAGKIAASFMQQYVAEYIDSLQPH